VRHQHQVNPGIVYYDLIITICQLQDGLSIQLKFEHAKGHQDTIQSLALLHTAWMNIKMDAKAKQQAKIPYHGLSQYTIPYEDWQCLIQGQCIIKQLPSKLREHINEITIQNHWAKKHRYNKGTAHMSNWDTANQAMQSIPMAHHHWVAKLSSRFLPYYRVNMKRWNLQTSNHCPQCHEPVETKTHIHQCQATDTKCNGKLHCKDNWMMQVQNTNSVVHNDIINGL